MIAFRGVAADRTFGNGIPTGGPAKAIDEGTAAPPICSRRPLPACQVPGGQPARVARLAPLRRPDDPEGPPIAAEILERGHVPRLHPSAPHQVEGLEGVQQHDPRFRFHSPSIATGSERGDYLVMSLATELWVREHDVLSLEE